MTIHKQGIQQIRQDVISELTPGAGVTIDGVPLKDGNVDGLDASGVEAGATADQTPLDIILAFLEAERYDYIDTIEHTSSVQAYTLKAQYTVDQAGEFRGRFKSWVDGFYGDIKISSEAGTHIDVEQSHAQGIKYFNFTASNLAVGNTIKLYLNCGAGATTLHVVDLALIGQLGSSSPVTKV